MKKMISVLLIVLTVLFVSIAGISPAMADHDDFSITYTLNPEVAGYLGADVGISIRVTNNGTTPITGFRVGVTTMAGYSQTWTGTINPGSSRTVVFTVPFAEEDLNADKLLAVSIENDGNSDYADGTQVRTFQVEGTHDIFEKTSSIAPDWSAYRVGDTINVVYTFRNLMEANAATGMTSEAHMFVDGTHVFASSVDSHGIVMPDETVSSSFEYTFTQDDIGFVDILYHIQYTMMGYDYIENDITFSFDVYIPEFDFEAELFASPTTIDAGDEVEFTIEVTDTGDTTITGGDIRNSEGGLVDTILPTPIGGTRPYVTTEQIYETTDVSFVVYCEDRYGQSGSIETNTVRITVREPEESPSPLPSESSAVTATPVPSVSPTGEIQETPAAVLTADETDDSAEAGVSPDSSVLLYIIIGVLGAIVIAGAVTVTLLMRRRKTKKPNKKRWSDL